MHSHIWCYRKNILYNLKFIYRFGNQMFDLSIYLLIAKWSVRKRKTLNHYQMSFICHKILRFAQNHVV